MIVFASAVAGCRRSLQCWPRDGGSSAAPFPWTPSPAHRRQKRRFPRASEPSSQAHPVLETKSLFRLILYWIQIDFPGSFLDWKMLFDFHFHRFASFNWLFPDIGFVRATSSP